MVKVLIPLAGPSTLDEDSQYIKSLHEIQRKTVLQHVVDSLSKIEDAEFIFVIRKEDVNRFHMDNVVRLMVPNSEIVVAESNTAGSACTCLLAIGKLSADEPLIISGSDQLVEWDLQSIVSEFEKYDAGAIVFDDVHPRWSYVKIDSDGFVIEAAEKNPISRNATTGFFYFKKVEYFTESVMNMIRKDASVNGAYYVCPALNELVLANLKIKTVKIPKECYFNFNSKTGVEMYKTYLKKSE